MKKISNLAMVALASAMLFSCQKDKTLSSTTQAISGDVLMQIKALGFGTSNVKKHEDGYLVEGDIILTPEILSRSVNGNLLRVANSEQYSTTNLVTGLPKSITVSVASNLPSSYVTATDSAIARYNAQSLSVTFSRVASGASIAITAAPKNAQYLASAGFPTAAGDPYNKILVSTRQIGSQPLNTVTSILAHEMGHCIGFRHTDYMDRSYSCGGSFANEGASTVGAIPIPGTPTTADPNSWMLACIGSGQNRPFNANDITALNFLY
ncbi:hypothetical protein BH10BAC3_BH10BAC3_20820 [soil metagenome]